MNTVEIRLSLALVELIASSLWGEHFTVNFIFCSRARDGSSYPIHCRLPLLRAILLTLSNMVRGLSPRNVRVFRDDFDEKLSASTTWT